MEQSSHSMFYCLSCYHVSWYRTRVVGRIYYESTIIHISSNALYKNKLILLKVQRKQSQKTHNIWVKEIKNMKYSGFTIHIHSDSKYIGYLHNVQCKPYL